MPSQTSTQAAALLAFLAAAPQASATWLHCTARAAGASGDTAYFTTVVGVGAVNPARLGQLRQRLVDYVAKTDPDAHAPQVQCFTFEDQLLAESHYSKTLNATSMRMGWDHVVVVNTQSWLPDSEIVDDPARP